jgi:threonine/homoserine/homoserine lactone efflux protein
VPDTPSFMLFVVAAPALLLVPVPAVYHAVARRRRGRFAGLVSCPGIEAVTLVYTAARVGISAILTSFATAFAVVKRIGVAYPIWLGLQKLLARRASFRRGQRHVSGGVYHNTDAHAPLTGIGYD